MDEEEFWAYIDSLDPEEQEQALYDFGMAGANEMPGMYGDVGIGGGMLPELGYGEFDVGTYNQLPPELNKKGELVPWGLDQEAQAYNAMQDIGSMTFDNALAAYGGAGAYDASAFQPTEVPIGRPLDMSDARYLDAMAESGAGWESYIAKAIRDKNMNPGQAVADMWNFINMGGEEEVSPESAEVRRQLIASLPAADIGNDPTSKAPSWASLSGDFSSPEGRAANTNMDKIEAVAADLFERKAKIPEAGYIDPTSGLPFASSTFKPSAASEKYIKAGVPTPDETYMDEEWLNAPLDPAEMEAQLLAEEQAQTGYARAIEEVNQADRDVPILERQMREWEKLSRAEAEPPRGGAGAITPAMYINPSTGAVSPMHQFGQSQEAPPAPARTPRPYVNVAGDRVSPLFDYTNQGVPEEGNAGMNQLMGQIYDFFPGGAHEGFDTKQLTSGLLDKARGGRQTTRTARQKALDEQIRVHERTSGNEIDRASAVGRAIALQRAGRTPTNDILMQRALARRTLMGR